MLTRMWKCNTIWCIPRDKQLAVHELAKVEPHSCSVGCQNSHSWDLEHEYHVTLCLSFASSAFPQLNCSLCTAWAPTLLFFLIWTFCKGNHDHCHISALCSRSDECTHGSISASACQPGTWKLYLVWRRTDFSCDTSVFMYLAAIDRFLNHSQHCPVLTDFGPGRLMSTDVLVSSLLIQLWLRNNIK